MSEFNTSSFNETQFNDPMSMDAEAALACSSTLSASAELVGQEYYTILNDGAGGDYLDMTEVMYPTAPNARRRQRVVVAGESYDEIADGDSGLVVRSIHSPYPGTSVVLLDVASNVFSNTETTICSYTVPIGKTFYLLGFIAHGDIHSTYKISLGSTVGGLSTTSVLAPTCRVSYKHALFDAPAGDEVALSVIHQATGKQGEFEGTIVGYVL